MSDHSSYEDYASKNVTYYQGINNTLLRMIPTNVKQVLDIGCAEGNLGAAVKAETGAYVAGIELFSSAGEIALTKLDEVVIENIETVNLADLALSRKSFDSIIFGDVLEHLINPSQVLTKVKPLLSNTGCVLASIPNIGHISIIESLLSGAWTYTDAGLLDKTHYRFFTRNEIVKLFESSGYIIESLMIIPFSNPRYDLMIEALEAVNRNFQISTEHFKTEATAYQYVIRAKPV
ncbi:class I SAM-dependent methyltransferase [Peribacillus sp. NPDC097295]|uniref:class I SAM-dependent methyltransferase n=1 Tax=Peribacillus sp. NPDC097295 TaxID=3364402 RepID=UPI0037F4C122